MKKFLFVLLIFMMTCGSLFAWDKLEAGGVVDVAVAENGTVFVAITNGALYVSKTRAGGFSKVEGVSGVVRVSMNSNGSVVGIVNKDKDMYISKDSGASWTKSSASGVLDVSVGKTYSFLVNSNHDVYYTKDQINWTKTTVGYADMVVFGGPFIMISDRKGVAKIANFSGSPEMKVMTTSGAGAVDIDVAPNGNLWLSNTNGDLYFSKDKGKSWNKDSDASGVKAVSLCNKYTVITNVNNDVYIRNN